VDVEACVSQHEQAQVARRDGKLLTARKSLSVCLDPSCPSVIRKDCAELSEKNAAEIATLVFQAESAQGPVVATAIKVDDESVPSSLGPDGFEVDPGSHRITALVGGESITETVVVRAGEKRHVVRLAAAKKPAAVEPAPVAASSSPNVLPWALGGVGVLGVAGFTIFGLRGMSMESDLDACKPTCNKSQIDDVRSSYVIGDISLAVGVVALGAAAVLFLTAPEKAKAASAWLGPPRF
jgi:hypothetical protein